MSWQNDPITPPAQPSAPAAPWDKDPIVGPTPRQVLSTAVTIKPDAMAEAERLAKRYPAPAEVIVQDLEAYRLQEVLDLSDSDLQKAPMLRELMRRDVKLAAMAQDDIPVLTKVGNFVGDLGGAMKAGVFRASRGAAGTFQAGLELVAPALDIFEPVDPLATSPGLLPRVPFPGGNPLRRLAEGFALQGQAAGQTAQAARPKTEGVIEGGFFSGIESLTQNLITLPAAFLPGGQGFALSGMTAFTGGDAYQQAREKGLPMSQALPFAASQAAIEYATEKLPLGALLKDVRAGAGFLQILGRQVLLEVPGEQIATVLQDLNEWAILNPEKPFTSYLEERPSAAAQTLVATIVGTGGNVAVAKGLEAMISRATRDGANMQRAGLTAQALEQALRAAEASKLRERSPEQFRALMTEMAEDGSVYVDAEVLNQMPPELLQRMEGVAEALPEALLANAPVAVKLADVLTVTPGTPQAEVFMQNARSAPDAPSLVEAEEAGKQAQQFLQQEAQRVIAQAQDQEAMRASSEAVRQSILTDLNTAGRYRGQVNEGMASWASAFYTAYSARLGITPEEMYQRYRLRVLGAPTGQGGQGDVLNAPAREFDREGLPIATMQEVQAVADIPTVEKVQEAIDTVGEEEFARRVETKMRSLGVEMTPEREAMATEAVAINIVALNRAGQGQVLNQEPAAPAETLQGDPVEPSDDVAAIVQGTVPESVDAGATLANMLQVAKGKVWQKGRDLKVAMQEGLQALARAAGVDVGAPSPQTTEYLVRVGLQDALLALEQNKNAIGWYDLKTRQALAVMALVHPEIATDQDARLAFVWALAVTSNGLKVGKNFEIAEQVYRTWKASAKKVEDRRMPTNAGIGTAKNAINKSLAQFNELAQTWGLENLRRFMQSNFTVGQITAIAKELKPGGEHADVTVRGAAILGPKIGNGFFSNLYGNFAALTMDRWLIRTWGRWTGTLIRPMPVQTGKARDRLAEALRQIAADETERARLSEAINTPITADMSVDQLAVAVQEASVDPAVREVLNQTDTGVELRKAGNSLAKYLDGQKEAPAGPLERKYIREVFGRILDNLRQDERYANLTMADLQAVLWYAEKRLYESAKQDLADDDTIEGYADDEAPDYANAAADVARKAGVTSRRINIALNTEARGGRSATARPGNAEQGAQAGAGQPPAAGGFTEQAKRFFIGARAVLRLRSDRDGAGQPSGAYARAGDGGRGKARLLKALGVTYVEEWKPSRSAGTVFKANQLAAPQFVELAPGEAANAQRFADAITASKQASGAVGAAVYVYPTADYAGMRLFLAKDGKSGFALKPDGDIVSVFSQGGAGRAVMALAVSAGGTKLDAFDTILPEFYSAHGFVAVSRLTWDDSQAPAGWDKAALQRYNNGEPDVVFMVYDPTFTGGYSSLDGKRFAGTNAYDNAVANQTRAVRRVAREQRQRARAARQAAQRAAAPAAPAQGQEVLEQGARGTFNPRTLELVLNPNADLSTWFHETGHFFLEVLADIASQPGAPAQIVEDMNTFLKWSGVPDLATWNGYTLDQKRPYHERWAESIEQYVMEGRAPNAELQPLMRRFRAWLINVYQSIKQFMAARPEAEQTPLNDDIRRVMDRMLATDEQIQQANEVAGLVPDEQADGEAAERLQKRSMADLKWAVKARDKVIAKLKKEAREVEKATREAVTAEVEQQPLYRAMRWLKKGETTDPVTGESVKAEKGFRLNTEALAAMYPETMLARPDLTKLRGMTSKDGLAPETVADMFGYETADQLVRALVDATPMSEVVDALTERRMLEEHGDLIDERAIQEAANEAVHNEARARSLATELRTQQEMLGQRTDTGQVNARGARITVNALIEAAKQFGANVVARTSLRDLKATAWKHTAAERRAGKRWQEHTAKGETADAVKAKQDQVLNNAAAKAALDAATEAKKILEFFKRVTKGNDEKVVEKGRDPDIVNAARAVLAAYGIETPTTKAAAAYLEALQQNDPETAAVVGPMILQATQNAQPLEALTFEELQGLHESIQAMWHLAKRSRQMEVDGDLMDIDDAADELYTRMEEIGIPDTVPGESGALTKAELIKRAVLQQAPALLRRVEQWAEAKDGKFGGPFLRLIFQPIKDAADRYRAERLEYRKKFQALVDNIAPMMPTQPIEAPELNYTFGRGHNGIGMAELLHAILHTGNESNKRKLLLGRGWATELPDGTLDTSRWDAFIQRLANSGVLQREHFDFAQGVWDLLEQTKPLAQKTHRDVFGRYFAEVTADTFTDPFGVARRGGYVPAQADPLLVQDAELRDLLETENAGMSYAFPQTNRGFTKSRVEYNRPLKLDLRSLPQHIDKVLLFSHMESPVRAAARLIKRPKVSQPLGRIDPAAISGVLKPWLNRSARQTVETPISADAGLNRMMSTIRGRVGMALMFANLSNTLQQITGVSSAAIKVRPALMMRAVAEYVASPKKFSQAVWDASPYMADRASNEVAVLSDTLEKILINPSVYESAEQFTRRHSYFLQTAFDNVLSPIIWQAAYNQGLVEGMEERMAIRYADGVIRQTQGSTLPEDVSRIETGPAYARIFTQFVGYFNMLANTNATALQQIAREQGLKKGAGKAFSVLMLGLMVPIWVAEAIALAFKGGPDDEDDDGYLDDWLAQVIGFGTIKGVLSGIPFVGALGQSVVNRFNDQPADDKFSLSPTVSVLESAAGAPASVYKAIVDDASAQKAVRDVAALVTVTTGLPAMTLARPVGYGAGVAQGRIEPTSAADAARGLVTGTASPESKQR
jgi:hypothetical protein